jgi:hypothetical protein
MGLSGGFGAFDGNGSSGTKPANSQAPEQNDDFLSHDDRALSKEISHLAIIRSDDGRRGKSS